MGPDKKNRIYRQMAVIAVAMMIFMTTYEVLKQLILPELSIWGSHVTTIVFTTILATAVSYLVMRKFYTEYEKRLEEIASRKRVENSLRNSENRLSQIVEFLPDAGMVVDKNGVVTHWNRAMVRLTGMSKADMVGKGNYEYAIPFYGKRRPILIDLLFKRDADIEGDYLDLVENAGTPVYAESLHSFLGESSVYLAATAASFFDADGNVVGAIEILRDITNRKSYEMERDQLIAELQDALANVKTLSGLLPICAKCKKVRDNQGYWKQIETYIEMRSDAHFSHGLCDECKQALYGDQDWYRKRKNS